MAAQSFHSLSSSVIAHQQHPNAICSQTKMWEGRFMVEFRKQIKCGTRQIWCRPRPVRVCIWIDQTSDICQSSTKKQMFPNLYWITVTSFPVMKTAVHVSPSCLFRVIWDPSAQLAHAVYLPITGIYVSYRLQNGETGNLIEAVNLHFFNF